MRCVGGQDEDSLGNIKADAANVKRCGVFRFLR
jgi:hypothetical protein